MRGIQHHWEPAKPTLPLVASGGEDSGGHERDPTLLIDPPTPPPCPGPRHLYTPKRPHHQTPNTMSTTQVLPPPVAWAQRKNVVFLTICVEDCREPTITIEDSKIYFKGTGGAEKKDYEYTYNLFKDIDAEKSRSFVRDRNIELILVKREEGPFWPHLLKEKVKQHWLKVDFSRWKDEDDSDDEGEGQNQDLEEMMRQMGGLGGDDSRPSLDDLEDEDSDDEDLPDLE